MFDNLWVEKYRPKSIHAICIDKNIKQQFDTYSNSGEIPNLLFLGRAGIGKTSLAKIIVNEILKCQYLYINASDENGIDTIRSKVTRFAQTKSLDGGIKVIILDEVDGLTMDAQRALRNTMEEYSENCRFILTANFKHRVIEPLQSRAQTYDLTPPYDQYRNRIVEILKSEGVEYDEASIESVRSNYYPDLRKGVNEIQKSVIDNKLVLNLDSKGDELVKMIYAYILKSGNPLPLRSKIISKEQAFNADYSKLLKNLFEEVCSNQSSDELKKKHLIIISEHMYRAGFVVDQEINFFSCLLNISEA